MIKEIRNDSFQQKACCAPLFQLKVVNLSRQRLSLSKIVVLLLLLLLVPVCIIINSSSTNMSKLSSFWKWASVAVTSVFLVFFIAHVVIPFFGKRSGGVMGSALKHRPRSNIYFMFTIVPPHSHRIKKVLEIMRHQTLVPNGVILNVPTKYKRFNDTLLVDEETMQSELLRINRLTNDSGPLSKYLGAKSCDDNDIIIIGDDDQDYSKTFVEDFVSVVDANHAQDTVYSGDIDKSFGGSGVMGFSGVAGRAWMFKQLPREVTKPCFLADDVLVTIYLQQLGLKVVRMFKRTRDKRSKDQKDATSINHFVKVSGPKVYNGCAQELSAHPLNVTRREGKHVPVRQQ